VTALYLLVLAVLLVLLITFMMSIVRM